MNLNSKLQEQGFVHIPQVLSASEVKEARAALSDIFSQKSIYQGDIENHPKMGNIRIDIFTRYAGLRWILFNNKIIESLRKTLGEDFIFLPETAIHDSGYGDWHKDTTSQEKHGQTFHWEDDFLVVQVGIYLQDNTEAYGGGLEVIPYSHKRRDRFANMVQPSIGERIVNKLSHLKVVKDHKEPLVIESKAGDMVIFNLKLDHKATHPKVKPVPVEMRKLAIFMVCSTNNNHARSYVEYIKSRPDYYYLNNHEYPTDLLEKAKENNINLMNVKL